MYLQFIETNTSSFKYNIVLYSSNYNTFCTIFLKFNSKYTLINTRNELIYKMLKNNTNPFNSGKGGNMYSLFIDYNYIKDKTHLDFIINKYFINKYFIN